MKILASIIIKGVKTTQPWELIEDEDGSVLVISQSKNGDIIGIVLDNNRISELKGHESAQRNYSGHLDISNAEIIPRAGSNSN
jgi:hypothetical protein